jgi:hypothetical protein
MNGALAVARLIVPRRIREPSPTEACRKSLGGGICEIIELMDDAYNLQEKAHFLGPYEPMLIEHPPSHYLRTMYIESTCYWASGARCALPSGRTTSSLEPTRRRSSR